MSYQISCKFPYYYCSGQLILMGENISQLLAFLISMY